MREDLHLPVCKMVPEVCEKRIPYTVCKMVPEQRVKTCTSRFARWFPRSARSDPYTVCKMVPEQR